MSVTMVKPRLAAKSTASAVPRCRSASVCTACSAANAWPALSVAAPAALIVTVTPWFWKKVRPSEFVAASDLDDAPVADAYRRDHAVVRIERQKAAVDEVEIARAFAFRIVPPRIVLPRRPRCPREQRSARCHRRRGLHEPAARQAPLLQIFTRHWRSSLMCR